jgi:hypothetical protein
MILIIFLVDRFFFEDKLAAGEVDTIDIKKDITLIAVVSCVGFKVFLRKYSNRLNSLVIFCE